MKKKWLIGIFALMVLCCIIPIRAVASLGSLPYWYSDEDSIGRWNASSLTVYKNKLNNNGNFYFIQGISYGVNLWEDVTDLSILSGTSTSFSTAPIQFQGGTVAEINAYGTFTATASNNGLTQITYSIEGTWSYGSATKSGWLISNAIGYIVDKNHTTDEYKNTCTHELGHALGWYGHTTNPVDIMYSYGSSVTTLSYRDTYHLAQVY